MTELLKNWIFGLVGAAVFCGLMTELCPKGSVKTVLKTLCGMVMAIALISPLLSLDMPSYSMNLAKYRREGEKIAAAGKESADNFSRTIIEEECRAYILDKGKALGAYVSDASVGLKWSGEGFWYPVECEIKGKYHSGLASAISGELGIGEERQEWTEYEGA